MKAIFYWIIAALAIVGVVSCNDSAGVGGSLAEEDVVIVIDSNFTVTASDVRNNVVQSRTLRQLIGDIAAPG